SPLSPRLDFVRLLALSLAPSCEVNLAQQTAWLGILNTRPVCCRPFSANCFCCGEDKVNEVLPLEIQMNAFRMLFSSGAQSRSHLSNQASLFKTTLTSPPLAGCISTQ